MILHLHSSFVSSFYCECFISLNFKSDADVRLARRIRRDTVEKGRDIGAVLDQVGNFPF